MVGSICGVGAFLLRDGGGASSTAAVREASPTASVVSAEPTGWSAATLQPFDSPSGPPTAGSSTVSGSAGAAAAVSGSASPSVSAPASALSLPDGSTATGAVRAATGRVGTGRLLVVPGAVRAPGRAPSMKVRVEVEQGISVDGATFARFVMATLNDSRSWGHGGTRSFARTAGPADFRVVLAGSPTAHQLCISHAGDPGSCGGGDLAVVNLDQWLDGVPDYGSDLTAFRAYAVNHEVGHVLGHPNGRCTPGHLAPVMLQQSDGLRGCLPNAWPFPRS
ncbi:MAG TPA: DUF3152 domain-containing protein [Kineosporiaceae bacterium]|nr:DUF3152 domain-containing protein [Kineosporiaceae bacterium]